MTISSTTRVAGPFTGNGSAATFSFNFKVFDASDLLVVQLDVATSAPTTLELTTDYTVALNSDQDANPGGSITLTAGDLATGKTLTLTTDIAELQGVDLANGGGFYPDVINGALDRLTILIQQVRALVGRAVAVPLTDAGTSMTLPAAAERAGKLLMFDGSGKPTLVDPGMRALRIADIDVRTRFVYVCKDGAKNRFRERSIPLVDDAAFEAARRLLARAKLLGAAKPDDYLFPFCKNRRVNPAQHMTVSGIKAPWNEVRLKSGLRQFYPYATRHTAITRMAESGIDFPIIQSFAGHISKRMTQHYIQICDQAKRRALEKLVVLRKPPQSTHSLVRDADCINEYAINSYGT